MLARIVFVTLIASALARVPGQTLPIVLQFDEPVAVLSSTVFDLGDVDGDGCDDFGLRALAADPNNNLYFTGRAAVYSGRTSLPIHDFVPWFSTGMNFPSEYLKLPDLNGDGFAEFATIFTIFGQTQVIFSDGASGSFVGLAVPPSSFTTLRVVPLGDVDGDGIVDLGLGSTGYTPTSYLTNLKISRIDIFSGSNYVSNLYSTTNFLAYVDVHLPCDAMVDLGDLNGDGFADFICASSATSILNAGGGSATIYSGQTSIALQTWFGAAGDALGTNVTATSDLDGDNHPDVLIFSPGSDVAGLDAGVVQAFSSSTGAFLFDVQPVTGEKISALLDAGDHNGDGIKDFILDFSATATSTIRRELRSGINGVFLGLLAANEVAVGDVNGDGVDDLLSYATGVPTPTQTRYTVRSLLGAQSYGTAPGAPQLNWVPSNIAASFGTLELSLAAPLTPVVGVVSFAPANTLVFGTALPLYVSDAPADLYGLYFDNSDAMGKHYDFINLAQPGLGGIKVFIQYGVLGATPITTNAVQLLFGP